MLEISDMIGMVAFAVSGFLAAVRSRLDFLGVFVAVFLTAFGGGIIRDVIVDRTPIIFKEELSSLTVVGVMISMLLLKVHRRDFIENHVIFVVSDSIGLASFSITGALVAVESHFNTTGVLAMAFVTAVGGGIMRDVIINEVPFVFKTGFYGTVALLIGAVIVMLDRLGWMCDAALALVLFGGIAVRLAAYYRRWSIPLP